MPRLIIGTGWWVLASWLSAFTPWTAMKNVLTGAHVANGKMRSHKIAQYSDLLSFLKMLTHWGVWGMGTEKGDLGVKWASRPN